MPSFGMLYVQEYLEGNAGEQTYSVQSGPHTETARIFCFSIVSLVADKKFLFLLCIIYVFKQWLQRNIIKILNNRTVTVRLAVHISKVEICKIDELAIFWKISSNGNICSINFFLYIF